MPFLRRRRKFQSHHHIQFVLPGCSSVARAWSWLFPRLNEKSLCYLHYSQTIIPQDLLFSPNSLHASSNLPSFPSWSNSPALLSLKLISAILWKTYSTTSRLIYNILSSVPIVPRSWSPKLWSNRNSKEYWEIHADFLFRHTESGNPEPTGPLS